MTIVLRVQRCCNWKGQFALYPSVPYLLVPVFDAMRRFWLHRWTVQHHEVIKREWVSSLNCRYLLSTFSTVWLECQDIAISRMDFPYRNKNKNCPPFYHTFWNDLFPPIASPAVCWDEDITTGHIWTRNFWVNSFRLQSSRSPFVQLKKIQVELGDSGTTL